MSTMELHKIQVDLEEQTDTPVDSFLVEVQRLMANGERIAAAELLDRLDEQRLNAEQLRIAALLAEECGALAGALTYNNQLLRVQPDDTDALHSLVRLRLDLGETQPAMLMLQSILEKNPGDVEAILELGKLKEATGEVEQAIQLYQEAAERAGDTRLERAALAARRGDETEAVLLENEGEHIADEGEHKINFSPEQGDHLPATLSAPSDLHTVALAELFAGREGVHARQWHSEGGRTGYTPVRQPFTPTIARQHLLGAFTVGIYLLRLDNKVGFLCLDLDLSKEALIRGAESFRAHKGNLQRLLDLGLALQDTLASADVASYLEDSGKKGLHLWVFFERPVPAQAARRIGQGALGQVQVPEGVQVELFPKQSSISKDSLGNLVKLPLGVHLATSRRALFIDGEGIPVPDQLGHLLRIKRVPIDVVSKAIEQIETMRAVKHRSNENDDSAIEVGDDDDDPDLAGEAREAVHPPLSAWVTTAPDDGGRQAPRRKEAVHDIPYRLDEDVEVQRVLTGCAVLAEITARAKASRAITSEERIVICHTLGGLSNGSSAVNAILDAIEGLDPSLRLVRRLRGNPISCAKIRSRLPLLVEQLNCSCDFLPRDGSYQTPVLHAATTCVAEAVEVAQLQIDQLVRDYLKAQDDLCRLTRRRRDLVGRLQQMMECQGIDELNTSLGTVRINPSDGELILSTGPATGPATGSASEKV